MIVSRLPPSRFTGDIATSIHTHAFHCFVSTARHFVVSRRWETMIFDGDPGVDKLIPCARLFYPAGFKRDDIYDIHEIIGDMLNEMGEDGKSLIDAAALVIRTALENGVERAFEN